MLQGFKEWSLICDALGTGAQSIILRKGGIAEGRAGFQFAHPEFLLFPTLFHEQVQKLTVPPETPLPHGREDGKIEIRYGAQVEWTRELTDLEQIRRLQPFHCWRPEVIEERFHYSEKPGVSLALVRVFRLTRLFVFPNERGFGGCRSWVKLPELPSGTEQEFVLAEGQHQSRTAEITAALES